MWNSFGVRLALHGEGEKGEAEPFSFLYFVVSFGYGVSVGPGTPSARAHDGSLTHTFRADDAKDAVQLRSSNGSIGLSVAHGWSGVIEASTNNGQVRFRDQDGMRQKGKASILAVGAGGSRSITRTSNGSIEVEVRAPELMRGPRL